MTGIEPRTSYMLGVRLQHWATPQISELKIIHLIFLFTVHDFFFRHSFLLYSYECLGTHYIEQAGLDFAEIHLPLPPGTGIKAWADTPGTVHGFQLYSHWKWRIKKNQMLVFALYYIYGAGVDTPPKHLAMWNWRKIIICFIIFDNLFMF